MRGPTGNLKPFAPRRWEAPLVVRDSLVRDSDDLHVNSEVNVGGDTFISWAVTNLGPQSINQGFFVDLYFNGVVVQRWKQENGVSRNGAFITSSWAGISTVIKPFYGRHTLKLVVDPTDLIAETDETDNTFEYAFDWLEPAVGLPPSPPVGIFDLLPHVPEGWPDAIIANAIIDSTSNGLLSVNLQTYIRFAFANRGVTDVPEGTRFAVYLYFDDVLVNISYWEGVPAAEASAVATWDGLYEAVHVEPGPHKLRIEIDPLNQVLEINEVNNTYEVEFVWSPPVGAP